MFVTFYILKLKCDCNFSRRYLIIEINIPLKSNFLNCTIYNLTNENQTFYSFLFLRKW